MQNKKSYNINKKTKSSGSRLSKRATWLIVAALVLIAGLLAYKLTRPDKKEITVISTGNTQDKTTTSSSDGTDNQTKIDDKSTGSTDSKTTIVKLATPSGTFVSSHQISLSSASVVESTCNTTPGAKCSISFTDKNGVVRYLPEELADKNGTAFWSWSPSDAQLTTGTWKIKAIAKAGSQTKTASDPRSLEVAP